MKTLILICLVVVMAYGCTGPSRTDISDTDLMSMAEDSAADSKVTVLAELAATPETTDILYIVDDPGVTPLSKKITVANLLGSVVKTSGALGTPSSGTVTNLTGTASININGTIGATTPAAGVFTSIATSASATPQLELEDSTADAAGEIKIIGSSVSTDTYDSVILMQVDIAGSATTFMEIDGTDESVDFLKSTTLQAGDIITADLATDAVTTAKIDDSQITNALMADLAIDTAELATGAVETAKIEDNNVTAAKISDIYAYQEIPIAWMNGGTSEPDALDDSTREPYAYRTFAHAADEDLNFVWVVPADLSGTTIQFRVYYLVTNDTGPGAAEGVAFGLSGVSLGDNDASSGAKGTVVVIADGTLNAAQHDVLITGWSGDVTITNLLAGEVAEVALIRDVSDAVDDYAQVVGVFMVQIRYVQNPAR